MRPLTCHILIAFLTLCAVAHGQVEDRNNAANWYLRAFERYESVRMSQQEYMAVWRFEVDAAAGPSATMRQVMHRIEPSLNLARRAAHQSHVDFGYDPDPNAPADHLTAMRTLLWLCGFDVQYRIAEEDQHTATDRLGTMYRMAHHAASDRTMTGSFVGYSMFEQTERSMRYALDHAAIGQEQAVSLLRALEVFDDEDPFQLRQSIAYERHRTTEWMLEQFDAAADPELAAQEDEEALQTEMDIRDALVAVNRQQLEDDLHSADLMMQRVEDAFSLPKKDQIFTELGRIQEEAAMGEHGELASQLLGANMDRYALLLNARDVVANRVALMRGIADGTIDPLENANAAVWYMRAITILPRFDPQKFQKVRDYADVHDRAADDELIATLGTLEAQTIFKHLEQATRIRRCDFEYTTAPWPTVIRRYHPGMRDLARLLVADAARLIHSGNEAQYALAAQRIAMTNRLCGHLAENKSVTSSLIAHAAFKQNDDLAEAAINAKYIHGDMLRDMLQSIRFRATDPFGYESSISNLRVNVEKYVLRLIQEPETATPPFALAREFVAECTPERLLWLRTVFDQSERSISRGGEQAGLYLQNLNDAIDADAFHEAVAQADTVRRSLVRGEFESLKGVDVPIIADFKQRQEATFEDVRLSLARVRSALRPEISE